MHIKKTLLLFTAVLFIGGNLYAKPPIFLDNYSQAVKISKELDHSLIVLFSADWCVYCKKLKKDISDNLDKFEDTTICIVDIDKNPELAKKYKVRSIPKTIVFDKIGNAVKEFKGYINIDLLRIKNE